MTSRTITLLALIQLLTITLFAQVEQGFAHYKEGDFELALQAFQEGLASKKMAPFANYGIATIYADSTYSGYDIDLAWVHWVDFNVEYKKLKSKTADKYKKQFKIKSYKLKKKISQLAYQRALEQNTIEGFDFFLDKYSLSKVKLRTEIIQHRNQLAYNNALTINTYEAFVGLLDKYGKSFKRKSMPLFKETQKRVFESYIAANGWDEYAVFAKANKRNPYVKDAYAKSYFSIHNSKHPSDFIQFIESHPRSVYIGFARKGLSNCILENGNMSDFEFFVSVFPDHELSNDLWRKIYGLYKDENGKNGAITFLEKYPKYPFLEQVYKEIDIVSEQDRKKLVALQETKNISSLIDLVQTHPSRILAAEASATIRQEIEKQPSIFLYEKYIKAFPKSVENTKLAKKLYELYTYDLTTQNIDKFKSKYGVFYNDMVRFQKDKELAKRYKELGDYTESAHENYAQFIRDAAPRPVAYKCLTQVLSQDLSNKKWWNAKKIMASYQDYFKEESVPFNQLFAILSKPSEDIKIKPFGDVINSEQGNQYAPIISADANTLYFCGKSRPDNLGREDIFVANRVDGKWAPAQLVKDINTANDNEAPLAISVDGTQLMMFKGGKLCYSTQTKDGWSEVEFFPDLINAESWQADASLSSDGRALLFISGRDDIIGVNSPSNTDIYVCLKGENDEWAQVINLGAVINTPEQDRSPFLHPDMKTLYFCSAGHGGLGGLDVFKSTRLDDSWTNWSTPVNLGKEINTTAADWGYQIATDGSKAFFSSLPENDLRQQIFVVELPPALRPQSVSTVSGVLRDSDGQPIEAEIVIEDLADGKIVARLKSNPQTGGFFMVLPDNRDYSYFIKKENYFPISNSIDLTHGNAVEINADLDMYTMDELTETGINVTLQNIFFDTDKYDLKPASFSELNRLFSIIKLNDFSVVLTGHTDSEGSTQYNLELSQKRADAVKEYLVLKGISSDRVVAIGVGETQPVASNQSSTGKAKNRRVEIQFKPYEQIISTKK